MYKFSSLLFLLIFFGPALQATGGSLVDTISKIKPSIVGIGTYQKTRKPSSKLMGTGFVVTDGTHVVTNAHVVASELDEDGFEERVIFIGVGQNPKIRRFSIEKRDDEHDLALLRIEGAPLPALALMDSNSVKEGQEFAFTGFPIGAVLGLYPATHKGIVAAITPLITPAFSARQLTTENLRLLKQPYDVFQLDATAYPGNSGSPLYHPVSGAVAGVINKVFVAGNKESALSNPSGITYAIPSKYVKALLN